MTTTVQLPCGPRRLGDPLPDPSHLTPPTSRVAYAAAHVVADPWADNSPGRPAALDWDATLAFRHHLWSLGLGLGVADAMDTAQRGMGLDWPTTRELVRRSGAEAAAVGGRLACGAGTDQLPAALPSGPAGLARVRDAYLQQIEEVDETGATVVIMASRSLAAVARGPDDYLSVYDHLLSQVRRPVILHWLGPMFDPALAGYWGHADLDAAAEVVLGLIVEHHDAIDEIKMSLLNRARETALRSRLPVDVRLYTGDDLHYDELILGDGARHSDALLGAFDAVAVAAAGALRALDRGDVETYRALLAPTVPLARHCFEAPTWHYKTGLTFLAWLAGHQRAFTMVGGQESARSVAHLVKLLCLADAAGLLPDPDLAARRMTAFLEVHAGPAPWPLSGEGAG